MNTEYSKYEGYIKNNDSPTWNQSYFYNAYDPVSKTGFFIRLGLQENRQEVNTWFVAFKDGLPLFTRTNLNLPYTADRPATGVEIAGMRIHAEIPIKKTRITMGAPDFSANLVWDELHPMQDSLAMSGDEHGHSAKELHDIHLEGTSRVTGHIMHRGIRTEINGTGFRDIAAGARNWDAMKFYNLAWPVFENGTALSGIHARSIECGSTYMRMFHDGKQWCKVKELNDNQVFNDDGMSIKSSHWSFVDEFDRYYEFTGKPLFTWAYPLDTFALCEQMMEFTMADGTIGYGMYELGMRLPWFGLD